MNRSTLIYGFALFCAALLSGPLYSAASFDGNRWFLVEVSIFSNEYPDNDQEVWIPQNVKLGYPARLVTLRSLADFFRVENYDSRVLGEYSTNGNNSINTRGGQEQAAPVLTAAQQVIAAVGPFPAGQQADISFPDIDRQAFWQLPASLSDFQQTNRALERSSTNRLLFHGLWRQPVQQADRAQSVQVRGGQRYGDHFELEGSITIRFNPGEDRVVIDSNLWFLEFATSRQDAEQWRVPAVPNLDSTDGSGFAVNSPVVTNVAQIQESRAMRSNEYHYLDHPRVGIVIQVQPYDLPLQQQQTSQPVSDARVNPGDAQ